MAHDHDHAPRDFNLAFALGTALNLTFVLVEAGYGLASGSLALMADAGHNLSDVMALVMAWAAMVLANRRATARHTFGLKKGTILVSLASALFLYGAMGIILREALGRLRSPGPVAEGTVIAVAAVGVVINTATALLFMRGRKSDLNIKGAFLHMAGDAAISAGVVAAGIMIAFTGWYWLDPAVSIGIAVLILVTGWGLLRDSLHLAMGGVPANIDGQAVLGYLAGLPGVKCVHDLHIWAASTMENILTAHLVMPDGADDRFLHKVAEELDRDFSIHHATLQIERENTAEECRISRKGPGQCWPEGEGQRG